MSAAASFFRWRWSGAVGFCAMAVTVLVVDFAFNQLVLVPLYGEDTLLLQSALAVPLGVVTGVATRVLWNYSRKRALASSSRLLDGDRPT